MRILLQFYQAVFYERLFVSLAISAVIGLNVITMAMEYYMMPPVR